MFYCQDFFFLPPRPPGLLLLLFFSHFLPVWEGSDVQMIRFTAIISSVAPTDSNAERSRQVHENTAATDADADVALGCVSMTERRLTRNERRDEAKIKQKKYIIIG